MPKSKNTDIDPLRLFREELVAARRAAASGHDLEATVEAQLKLEIVERILADELRTAH